MAERADIVVAYDQNRAIGADGDLPWKRGLPSDLANFKALTLGETVIMGRGTFDSMRKRTLRERENIIVTRDPNLVVDGAMCVRSIHEAFERASGRLFVIGGSQIYEQCLEQDLIETIHATEVQAVFPEADTFFPAIDPNDWTETDRVAGQQEDDRYPFDFVTYTRN